MSVTEVKEFRWYLV